MPGYVGVRKEEIACKICSHSGHINEVVVVDAQQGGRFIRKHHCLLCGGVRDAIPEGNGSEKSDVSESDDA